MQVSKDLGMKYRLDELWTSGESSTNLPIIQPRPRSRETRLVEDMLELQQPKGSWGAYTVSTLLALMTLDHYSSFFPDKNSQIDLVTERALNFVDEMYFSSGESAYLGVLDDGRYWDTALMGIAALEAGTPASELRSTAEYLISRQSPNGGFAFGEDFEFAPDTDDTAEILLLLSHYPDFQKPVERALHWLRSMQNKNGGWGAFSKDNNGNFILAAYTRAFEDSADLFDESSADVTGHILEALGTYGWNPENSTTVRKAQ
ncbi:MAG TPA: hypothetical protein DCS07_06600, partial [Bdellovibrionales bacterium]|nr:hypothetical protein [Bdellovibrionales bacterium]